MGRHLHVEERLFCRIESPSSGAQLELWVFYDNMKEIEVCATPKMNWFKSLHIRSIFWGTDQPHSR